MCGNHAGIFQTKKKKKIKQKQWLISAFLLGLAAFFISLLVLNLDFQAWAFKCHQNQLSWHTPILFYSFQFYFFLSATNTWLFVSILALFTSMIWFPVPRTTLLLVKEFLTYEREFLQAGLTGENLFFAFLVLSFFILLIRATWLHSWKMVGLILVVTAFLKIIWSVDSGQAGLTIIQLALIGLVVCLLAISFLKKEKILTLQFRYFML